MAALTLPDPVFFDTDESVILAEMVAYYQGLVGKQLSPAQTEQLLIQAFAYREKMVRIAGNEAGKQMLLSFSSYPIIDYLGELLGVQRLPAANALCTLVFTMVAGHGPLVIPVGTRVQSTDGKVVFATLANITAQAADASVSIEAECTTEGASGNDYNPGDISIILDPVAFVDTCANSDITNAGSDSESDDALRDRIRLAPSSFSTAGPEDAYKYFAKSANPLIIDVSIGSPVPGSVVIYPLMAGGVAPSDEIKDAIYAKCNPKKVRPLNDIVSVEAPTSVDYAISVNLTLLKTALQQRTIDLVTANLTAYANTRQTNLGIDVILSQINAQASITDLVYNVVIISPVADIVLDEDQYANCTGISVNVVGLSDP